MPDPSKEAIEVQKKVLESIMKDMSDMLVETNISQCCDDGVNVNVSMHKPPKRDELDEQFDAVLLEVE